MVGEVIQHKTVNCFDIQHWKECPESQTINPRTVYDTSLHKKKNIGKSVQDLTQ